MRTITSVAAIGVAAAAASATLLAASLALAQPARMTYGFGTTPTPEELQRFISPLPDGRGLPSGSGSATQGRAIYAQQCESCHGDKLQGGMGDRLVGGRGTLVNDNPAKAPVKTVESYWPYATTLFDYIKRAMPLTSPGSLSNDEVYALCAYILSQGNIVAADTRLDANSLARVRMPNRDGFVGDPRPEKFPSPDSTPHQHVVLQPAAK
jgi:S-disulfanyl-L-cysteine oxidoreductase SoxD